MTTVPGRAAVAHGRVTLPFWQLLAAGVLTLVFGLAVLAWPQATLRLLGVLAGLWLLAIGLTRVIGIFRRSPDAAHRVTTRQVVDGAFGVLLVVIGLACLREVAAGVTAVAVLLGLAWLLSGFAELLLGMFAEGRTRTWLLVIGALSVALGLLFLAWPGLTLHALVLLTGITALVIGIAEIVVAFESRHHAAVTSA
ncbi:DUF308 domain-containing protein [Dactylosporangium sp. AC04546]|uniref:HdeD family acid-resistance protein n=1 Tax=Dactylosporangium sp. AC04546 TaxID=2862460 RepID=UPI001EDED5C6|nr:DUF308 domain-containing protein [Dactylosporangium sp. AC04546]WVK81262.1 DUF308 domain-containing protein [Dactylosporangium sp. AC04546]